jgi:hypothetical protein
VSTIRAAAAAAAIILVGGMLAPSQRAISQTADNKTLRAVPAPGKPVLDGVADAIWSKAPPLTIKLAGGHITDAHDLTVQAMYDADTMYFLYRWNDPTESLHRKPWEKQADGSWKTLKTTANDEYQWYEDKLAVFWEISAPTFAKDGCAASCHMGVGTGKVGVMKAPKGELFDMWHWKATRTNPVGQVDDMYLDDTEWSDKTPEAGRKADPRTGGGYNDNVNADKTGPGFGPADGKAAPHFLMKSNAGPFNDTYKAGDRLAGIVIAPMEGDRGDVLGVAKHDGKGWTLEIQRKRDTGSKFDVQFTDEAKAYLFAPAIFDSVQIRHAITTDVFKLVFTK